MPKVVAKGEAIVLAAGHSIQELQEGLAEFIESVNLQLESELEIEQVSAQQRATKQVEELMTHGGSKALEVRDRIAELYFAYLDRSKRIRAAVQQAESMARRDERIAESIRGNIEAFMLCSWDAKKITGNYHEFAIQKNPVKLNVVNETDIPEQFFDIPEPVKVLNKTRLSEYLKNAWEAYDSAVKAGINGPALDELYKRTQVPGCNLERNRTRLAIK